MAKGGGENEGDAALSEQDELDGLVSQARGVDGQDMVQIPSLEMMNDLLRLSPSPPPVYLTCCQRIWVRRIFH